MIVRSCAKLETSFSACDKARASIHNVCVEIWKMSNSTNQSVLVMAPRLVHISRNVLVYNVILSFKTLKDVVEGDFVVFKDTDKGLC